MSNNIRSVKGFFKFSLTSIVIGVMANSSAHAYELIDLGPNLEPKAINNKGVIVGSSNTDQYPTSAFRWSSDNGFELIDGTSSNAVNDYGQIAGSTIDGAFSLDDKYTDWSDYGAFGINQSGMVAGYSVGKNPDQPRSLPYNPAIFNGRNWEVFDIARLYPRGTREGVYADRFVLNAINDDGYAVGYKYRYGLAGYAAILIDTNVPVTDASDVVYLSTPYGGRATDINNNNWIVGTTGSNSSSDEYSYAFLHDGNELINLGTLPSNGPGSEPGLSSYAYDINDQGQVVGNSWLVTANTSPNDPTKYHAFLWENGQMSDLNDLVTLPKGWILTRATAINEQGDITGVGLVEGIEHGFLLTNGAISAQPPAQNENPVAEASADVYSGRAPLAVKFDSSDSYDPDGNIVAYSWNFMDGSYSNQANPSHKFKKSGSYAVTLTVTDELGMQSSSAITINVRKRK